MATALTQTTLSAAVTVSATVIPLTSVTGITAGDVTAGTVGSQLYVVDPGQTFGEIMNVLLISGTNVTVARSGSQTVSHVSGAMVLAGPPNAFSEFDPTGATNGPYTPWLNLLTGNQWLYSSVTGSWVPGFGNSLANKQVTAPVVGTAGLLVPSGPLFHVITTAGAITGFTPAVGGLYQDFSVFPDVAFTWTTATNIAIAGTAVVNRMLTFRWDATNAKFVPSYV